jgi:hypothetical protein
MAVVLSVPTRSSDNNTASSVGVAQAATCASRLSSRAPPPTSWRVRCTLASSAATHVAVVTTGDAATPKRASSAQCSSHRVSKLDALVESQPLAASHTRADCIAGLRASGVPRESTVGDVPSAAPPRRQKLACQRVADIGRQECWQRKLDLQSRRRGTASATDLGALI